MGFLAYRAVGILFSIMELAILIRAFISWLPVPRDHKLVYLLFRITEPILAPIRSMIAKSSFGRNIMIDFSSVVALILLMFLRSIILRLILTLIF